MKLSSRNQLILLAVWIFIVGALFAFISEKRIAAVIAGLGFIIIPMLLIFSEFQLGDGKKSVVTWAAIVFLVLSALPIFCLRVFNWDSEFNELTFIGISANFLHRASNILYFVVIAAVCWNLFRQNYSKKISEKSS